MWFMALAVWGSGPGLRRVKCMAVGEMEPEPGWNTLLELCF